MFIHIYIYSYMTNFFRNHQTIAILRNFKQNVKIVRVIDVFLIFSIHLCLHTPTHPSIPFPHIHSPPPLTHIHTHTQDERERGLISNQD